MAPTQDLEVEGVTAFAPPPTTSYHYILQLKKDKLSMWMEDRISKKQWYKGGMDKADYVTSANTVTDASALDYLQCFQDALDCELGKCGDVQRTLQMVESGKIRLGFAIQIRVLRSMRVAKYTFDLDSVSVERIDVLESKLRDQQDELERLRGDFDAGQALPFVQLEASSKNATTAKLLWRKVESDNFSVVESDGGVKIRHPGVYSVAAVVNNSPLALNYTVRLMKNGECVQTASCLCASSRCISSTLSSAVRFEEEDLLSVECDGDVGRPSYLAIAQLGR